ncbi:MAG: septation regulator SpoVG [Bacillota bacterium]|nr:septation regulator SpoVG [Bacillota bacterium]
MKITDIRIRKLINEGKVKAVVSVTFDDCLAVHDIRIIEGTERMFVATPSRKASDGTFRDIVHPINSEFRAELEKAIIQKYEEAAAMAAESEGPAVAQPAKEPPALEL